MEMALTQTKKLNDGVEIPVYGFGTFQIPADGSTYKAVREALDLGIRHIDTAVVPLYLPLSEFVNTNGTI